jgi:hypothetical protein
MGSGARLRATDTKNLLVKVALRTRDKVAQRQEELLKWIKHLNPELHTEHWRVLDKALEPNGQRLILLIDWDSYTIIKETGYKICTGLSQGTIKVLRNPEAEPQQGEEAVLGPASSETISEDGGLMGRFPLRFENKRRQDNGDRHTLQLKAYSCGPRRTSGWNLVC